MSERDKQLSKSWLGEILLAGKPLKPLSIGKMQKLELIGNVHFDAASTQSDINGAVEIVYAMTISSESLKEYCRLPEKERKEVLADFALDNEDELESVMEQVNESVKRIEIAKMESASEGKETRHV